MSNDLKFVELTADVLEISFIKTEKIRVHNGKKRLCKPNPGSYHKANVQRRGRVP